ncbi:flagellar basal body-associated FliL family protein [Dechloromonas sp. XY25]|uniref:Flagellar protein FliL n=1 Tax=Dechloromonas hankyongensis TaxID=2908002 RepID=A0ABS9K2L8_9RHOO|nr:flagellar basal body-associated FliL family protein [Dechloromonas hankyongensis]MCG2577429.1 flagellar basal body-associated FliL family protein [Dechloromonas hankyongensis]
MSLTYRVCKTLLAVGVILLTSLFPLAASANDHGGGGAPEPMVFTFNLGDRAYVQFGLIFETGSPEAAHELVVYRPKIQHEIILLMSGKEEAHLRTLAGKKELIEEVIELANHIIHEDRKDGVKEVLFTKFLIQ